MTMRLAHGYVRTEEADETQISLMCKDVARFCELNGYRLGSIFTDRGVPGDVFARTGFTALLDAVRLTQAQAVVVPTFDHLSAQASVRIGLVRMVETAGSQVTEVYQVNGHDLEHGGGCDLGCNTGASS